MGLEVGNDGVYTIETYFHKIDMANKVHMVDAGFLIFTPLLLLVAL